MANQVCSISMPMKILFPNQPSLQEDILRNKHGGSLYLDISLFEGFGYETRAEAVFISDQETFQSRSQDLKYRILKGYIF